MSDNPKIQIGLIGAGRIGRVHAAHLATAVPGAALAAIADVNLQAARELASQHGVSQVSQDYQELLFDPRIDAVVICSSTDTHAQIIRESARAGKHIFCEKPIDLDLQRIASVLKAVEAAGVKFQVGFNRRFDTNFQKAKQRIAGGDLGLPHLLRITSRDPAPPGLEYLKVSGGIFLDMTIHDFDMARFLLESEPLQVLATGDALVDPAIGEIGDIDTCLVVLQFENGTLACIDNSRQAVYGYDQRVEILGSSGMVVVGNDFEDTHRFYSAEAVVSAKPKYFFLERYKGAYLQEMRAFVDCILNDTPPPVTGTDGLRAVQMGLAAQKSFAEMRWVKMDEIGSSMPEGQEESGN